jgi:hypothetical protein
VVVLPSRGRGWRSRRRADLDPSAVMAGQRGLKCGYGPASACGGGHAVVAQPFGIFGSVLACGGALVYALHQEGAQGGDRRLGDGGRIFRLRWYA